MKRRLLTLVAVAGFAVIALAGCSRELNTAKIREELQSIDPGPKAQLELALSAIDAGKYKEAYPPLRKVAYGAKLDNNQRKVIEDTIAKVKAKIAQGK